jgi:hypothetical protein
MLYFMPVGRVEEEEEKEEEEEEEVEEEFRERKLHGGTNVLCKPRPGWFDTAAIRVSTRPLRRSLCTNGCVTICLGMRAIPPLAGRS